MKINYVLAAGLAILTASLSVPAAIQSGDYTSNPSGLALTVSSTGSVGRSGPFFQNLGTNGRKCSTCHVEEEGWAVSAAGVQQRFNQSSGLDPIFRTNDGANSPNADVSTLQARRAAFSMLCSKGLIRVERPIPPGAEFELVSVDDPYGYASATGLSLFRRPLPATNLRFISTVMWDGREVDPNTPMTIGNTQEENEAILRASLAHQAMDATAGHAQGSVGLTAQQQQEIVDFELGLSTAQVKDNDAGWLTMAGALESVHVPLPNRNKR